MEGEFRAGHFDGVGTIVEALLRSIKPNKAYFGEKDYQQLQIVKKLVKNKQIPVDVIGCPIVREKNGLAMSSRNERLSNEVRQKASLIFETLNTAKEKFGTKSALEVTNWVKNQFDARDHFRLEYFQIADIETLKPIKRKIKSKQFRAFIAVFADDIRLIDNIAL
jgi:pantoate--beta-alanine ligase